MINVVGIMNGTSLDGIDYVLTRVQKKGARASIRFIDQARSEFSQEMRSRLLKAVQGLSQVEELAVLSHDLGRLYAKTLAQIQRKREWKIDLVGVHGQTVFHAPPRATFQIGEPSYLSQELGVPVVSDFRVADLAAGGHGAPIASLFHVVALAGLFQKRTKKHTVALHNIGGISNLTLVSRAGKVEKAFDTGPGNMLLDLMAQKISDGKLPYDKDGRLAAQGLAQQHIVEGLLNHEYFQAKPPKSCGREQFGETYFENFLNETMGLSDVDRMATLVELTAQSIAKAYQSFCRSQPEVVILCGGGARNKFLKKRIQFHLPDVDIKTSEDVGWPVDAVEGGAFALLAAYRLWNQPSNLPNTTGAKRAVCLGKITI